MTSMLPTEIAAARLRATALRPYYAAAIFALEPTLATDDDPRPVGIDSRGRLWWHPSSITESVDTVAARIVHGLEHLLRDHAARGEAWTPVIGDERWIAACDCEINDDLDDLALPAGATTAAGLGLPDGRLAEWYADRFRTGATDREAEGAEDDSRTVERAEDGADVGDPHEDTAATEPIGNAACATAAPSCHAAACEPTAGDTPGLSTARLDQLRTQVADAVAAHQGTVPTGITRWATERKASPRTDWRNALLRHIRRATRHTTGADHHDTRRPSRRSPHPVLLPRLRGQRLHPAVVVDTSGSMRPEDLDAAITQIDQLLRTVTAGESVPVITCDAAVHGVVLVGRAADIDLRGGGGSDMGPGIEAALRAGADVVIVLTDGWVQWPEAPTRTPVIAGLIGDHCGPDLTPRWIRSLVIETDEEVRR